MKHETWTKRQSPSSTFHVSRTSTRQKQRDNRKRRDAARLREGHVLRRERAAEEDRFATVVVVRAFPVEQHARRVGVGVRERILLGQGQVVGEAGALVV